MREVTFTYIHIYIQGIFVIFSVTQTGFLYKLTNKVSHVFLYQGGGRFLIGQEQDNTSTSFNDIESFVGEITLLQIWNHVISDSEVRAMYTFCEDISSRAEAGSLIFWPEFRFSLTGTIVVLNSSFCSGKYPTYRMKIYTELNHFDIFNLISACVIYLHQPSAYYPSPKH